jgi:hypothetical protein
MQTVTADIKTARKHANCRRVISAEKRYAHRRERRAERQYVHALALQVDPDTGRNAAPAVQCASTSFDCGGTVRCRLVTGHGEPHHDGCVTWPNNAPPIAQADEPRKRQPRPLTGWDLW